MNIQDRIARIIHVPSQNCIIASDQSGHLHKFDMELNRIQSSPTTGYSNPITAITATDKFIFTKDRRGSIAKWNINDLRPIDIYDEHFICNRTELLEDEEPSPSIARGIAVLNGKVYTNNGYGQVVVLDAETFEVLEIRKPFTDNSMVDCICVEHPDIHVVSEIRGFVHLGNLETGHFFKTLHIDDEASVHWVRYDKRHNRFWATQDAGIGEDRLIRNGFVVIELDGTISQKVPFTNYDVEFLQFNEDYTKAYIGGFDGYIYVFDNTEKEIKLNRLIGPFKHQLTNLLYIGEDRLYLLLQNGEILCVDRNGNVIHRANYKARAIWALEHHPKNNKVLYCAKDDGVDIIQYEIGKYNLVNVKRIAKHEHNFGNIRRIKPLPDGSYVGTGHDKFVFLADEKGNIKWYKHLNSIPRSVSTDYDYKQLLVSCDDGIVLELKIEDGSLIEKYEFEPAVYATAYTKDGKKLIGTRNGLVYIFSQDGKTLINQIDLEYQIKRLLPQPDGKIYAVGSIGFVELDLENFSIKKRWTELLANTKENGVVIDNKVYVISYGFQLGSFDYETGELIDLIEGLQDIPKGIAGDIAEDGFPVLFVAGRGNYINIYRIMDGLPYKIREVYLD